MQVSSTWSMTKSSTGSPRLGGRRSAQQRGADAAASALGAIWEHWVAPAAGRWFCRRDGLFAAVTGLAVPTLNGVWTEEIDFDERAASELLDEVRSRGFPYCFQVRPGAAERGSALAAAHAMAEDEDIPLMVLEGAPVPWRTLGGEHFTIRRLDPQEAAVHNRIAAHGFDVPEEAFEQLITPEVLRTPRARCYIGEVDGEAVATGVGYRSGPFVGIFNVATPLEFRRRGYGAAITARAVRDGLDDGAQSAFLQSSRDGYGVYVRLGFRTVERWPCWVRAPGAPPQRRTSRTSPLF